MSTANDDDDSDSHEMPLCSGGFDRVDIARLMGIDKLLGIRGGIALDTGVVDHYTSGDDGPYDREIVVLIGTLNRPTTIEDIARALRSIPNDAWQQGRSYFWEGVSLSTDRRIVRWGS